LFIHSVVAVKNKDCLEI